jgi:hypothetical protein
MDEAFPIRLPYEIELLVITYASGSLHVDGAPFCDEFDNEARAEWFLKACAQGELYLVIRLAEIFELEADDIRFDIQLGDSEALIVACGYGHLKVARWLADHFGLNAEDAKARCCMSLVAALKRGHQAVARWLIDRFNLTSTDVSFRYCCEAIRQSGHPELLQWLEKESRFNVRTEQAVSPGDIALRAASKQRRPDVARWLFDRFGLTAADTTPCYPALRQAHAQGPAKNTRMKPRCPPRLPLPDLPASPRDAGHGRPRGRRRSQSRQGRPRRSRRARSAGRRKLAQPRGRQAAKRLART